MIVAARYMSDDFLELLHTISFFDTEKTGARMVRVKNKFVIQGHNGMI